MNLFFPSGTPVSKRLFDLCLTLPGLVLILPLLGLLTLMVWIVDGQPVFFEQQRPGYKGKIFTLRKFRTMRQTVDRQGRPLPDGERISRLGKILRATSLDELPELINILKGEMSLVGPRPLLADYLDRYTPEQMRRHDMPPGMTGWAQIHGRNELDWEERFALDVWYVDHWSLGLDMRILWQTFGKVFKREGISQPGQATMSEFMGTKK